VLYPLKLKPVLKDYIWGGSKLKDMFGIQTNNEIVAEAWELSTHKDGNNVVVNGEYEGKTLNEVLELCGFEPYCPVLIKFIDARENLSVQVHPNDEYALRVEASMGKTEMWYVLDCEQHASLNYGFKTQITKEEFERRIKDNTLTEVLNNVPVKKGDVFFIEAGTIHSIGAGIIIAEIQQNSNITYRVYDYGRVGTDGKARELHIEKALEVTKLEKASPIQFDVEIVEKTGYTEQLLSKCDYFDTRKLDIIKEAELTATDSFQSVLILEGKGVIKYNH
jgi:mannose-6-phosphate isomerase